MSRDQRSWSWFVMSAALSRDCPGGCELSPKVLLASEPRCRVTLSPERRQEPSQGHPCCGRGRQQSLARQRGRGWILRQFRVLDTLCPSRPSTPSCRVISGNTGNSEDPTVRSRMLGGTRGQGRQRDESGHLVEGACSHMPKRPPRDPQ